MRHPAPAWHATTPARALALTVLGALLALTMAVPAAADDTVVIDGDAQAGWLFNRDVRTSTPYTFSVDEASIGRGSLYVLPITNTDASGDPEPKDKFIAEQFLRPLGSSELLPASELESISYDFLIAGDGTAADANEFYLNVYTILPGSNSTYYDCRFDYVPATGSTSEFTTFSIHGATPALHVQPSAYVAAQEDVTCPTTLDGLPEGSVINFFALNVGDTSSNDTGLAGYYDNVVVELADGTTVYDFEKAPPTDKGECKKGGYVDYGFRNQGQCIAAVQANSSSGH